MIKNKELYITSYFQNIFKKIEYRLKTFQIFKPTFI